MSITSQLIVNKAWNFAHELRDIGLSYMAYTEQIKSPYKRLPIMRLAEPAGE